MSAQFIVTYLDNPVRFIERTAGRMRYDVETDRRRATVFVNEVDAWITARDFNMDMINTSVEPL